MSYFTLSNNGVSNPIQNYGELGNLRRIMQRNNNSFKDYIDLGNRTLPNQHPLVQFLLSFSVNLEWSPEYLINVIDNKLQQYASLSDLTSLYNRGKNHIKSIYPEDNHNTLLVVPFGKPDRVQINEYLSKSLHELVPLVPIYTTDTLQRLDIMQLLNTQNYSASRPLYTIVQIDPYALIIGFWRTLKEGKAWGNSPHGYLAGYPLMNCYIYHNELVNLNYLNQYEGKIQAIKGSWNYEAFESKLADYVNFKKKVFMGTQMKSFTNFYLVNEVTNPIVDKNRFYFPEAFKSIFFMQMSWIWTMGSLGLVRKYLDYNVFLGTIDGQLNSELRIYFDKFPLQTQVGQIKDKVWADHFTNLWNTVKAKVS
ncbi:putative virion structural protein [Pseudomonas phage OBP]|uniref:virion structural protein n=1 Tax=Pseudomonas phage OBP TaxID=1124849 RepID=UPI000240D635|nr:virion structural protein [Pseudomonas phage OBP]AEV89493.1 putative virion structural protein [Pseudomonas phage OBP]